MYYYPFVNKLNQTLYITPSKYAIYTVLPPSKKNAI